MTRRKAAILDAIRRYHYCPSLGELAADLGVTKQTVHQHLNELQSAGIIVQDRRHHTIRIVGERCTKCGTVALPPPVVTLRDRSGC